MLRSVHRWLERDSGRAKRRQALTTLLLILALLLMTLSSAPIRPSKPAMAEPAGRRRSNSRWQQESSGKRSERAKLELGETVDGCNNKTLFLPLSTVRGLSSQHDNDVTFFNKGPLSLRCGLRSAWISQWASSRGPKHCASLALCEKKRKEKKVCLRRRVRKLGHNVKYACRTEGFSKGVSDLLTNPQTRHE